MIHRRIKARRDHVVGLKRKALKVCTLQDTPCDETRISRAFHHCHWVHGCGGYCLRTATLTASAPRCMSAAAWMVVGDTHWVIAVRMYPSRTQHPLTNAQKTLNTISGSSYNCTFLCLVQCTSSSFPFHTHSPVSHPPTCLQEAPGAILVFVTGHEEAETLVQLITEQASSYSKQAQRLRGEGSSRESSEV